MPYDTKLAERIRNHLDAIPSLHVEEKEMFRGLAFMINGKMCVNVSGDRMMCRFDPAHDHEVAERRGFEPMIMKGRQLRGYCYVSEEGFKSMADFKYWMDLSLAFNSQAKSSKKKKQATPRKRSKAKKP